MIIRVAWPIVTPIAAPRELRNRAQQLQRQADHERDDARRWHLQDLADANHKAADQLAPKNAPAAEAARQLMAHIVLR